jgi:hypothetical protein
MAEEDIVMNEKESRSKDADYYHLNHDRFVGFFMWFYDRVLEYLTERRDCQAVQAICDRAKEEFEILLPNLPYMGGDERVTTKWVLLAGCFVAFYRCRGRTKLSYCYL